MSRGVWSFIALVVATAVTLVGAVAVVLVAEDEEPELTAEAVLGRAQRFVGAQDTARFVLRSTMDLAGAGFGGSSASRAEGEVVFPDRFHLTDRSAGLATEVIAVGDVYFVREAFGGQDLAERRWAEFGPADLDDRGIIGGPSRAPGGFVTSFSDGPALARPTDLRRVVRSASGPEITERTEDAEGRPVYRLAVAVDAARAFRQPGDVEEASAQLTVREDGFVSRIVVEASGPSGEGVMNYRMAAWGEPVAVEPPGREAIDPTPWFEEEDIAAFAHAPLYQLAAVPAGWELAAAFVLPAEDTVEGCDQVALEYIDPAEAEDGFLVLYQLPPACADPGPPPGADPFRAGTAAGWVDEDDGVVFAQVSAGPTVVQAETDLGVDELVQLLSTLQPLDLNRPPRQLPGGPTRA